MPPSPDSTVKLIRDHVAALGSRSGDAILVLAVSGGVDSMVLLDAAAAVIPRERLTVATFDHATGTAARESAASVVAAAKRLGIRVSAARAMTAGKTESEWRDHRWRFIRGVADEVDGTVVTAHTRDDQLETVVMRALRGAGPRGLAGLLASSDVARPFLAVTRAAVETYAEARDIIFVTDPSNDDRRHLRNLIRHDLLPALERARPGFGAEMLALAERAARWRAQMEAVALSFPMVSSRDAHSFERAPLRDLPESSLRTLWPSLAARAGVVLDWRGTARLAAFTIEGANGGRIQLAGGHEVRLGDGRLSFRVREARG